MESRLLYSATESLKEKEKPKMTEKELKFMIDYCSEMEESVGYIKARRSFKDFRRKLEYELYILQP